MKKIFITLTICSLTFILVELLAMPTVYPTGTTIYNPKKCWNGYTIFPAINHGAVLIDMNGNVVKNWKMIQGYPVRILPGGYVMGGTDRGKNRTGFHELVQLDFDGNVVWKFNKGDQIKVGDKMIWSARQNHDWQREGNPVGYYVPGMNPIVDKGKTLIVTYKSGLLPEITHKYLIRHSRIIEVTWEGKIVWDWLVADHFEEMRYSEEAKNTILRHGWKHQHCVFINTASYLGPNKLYDAGDERFHPDNIITDDRGVRIYIISKKTGKVVWMVGPDYNSSPALRELGCIIGPHHAHMIPKGLPGEGNILVFDNGGAAGYGAPNPGSPTGEWNALRDYSRVIEFNPITLKKVWEYSARAAGFRSPHEDSKFYSHYKSSAQRLPNGNTLITEGCSGRFIEVTPECEIVWEYVSPFFSGDRKNKYSDNGVFRAYRVPYDWVPQLKKPVEKAVIPPDLSKFRIRPVGNEE